MRSQKRLVRARDGVEIVVRGFSPDAADADRTLLIVHGMSEHSQRYEHIARVAVAHRWNVVVPDLRGHGYSGGPLTHCTDFREYVNDLQIVADEMTLNPRRTAVVGHSMGGLIAARFAQECPDRMAALVLVS